MNLKFTEVKNNNIFIGELNLMKITQLIIKTLVGGLLVFGLLSCANLPTKEQQEQVNSSIGLNDKPNGCQFIHITF